MANRKSIKKQYYFKFQGFILHDTPKSKSSNWNTTNRSRRIMFHKLWSIPVLHSDVAECFSTIKNYKYIFCRKRRNAVSVSTNWCLVQNSYSEQTGDKNVVINDSFKSKFKSDFFQGHRHILLFKEIANEVQPITPSKYFNRDSFVEVQRPKTSQTK